MPVPGKRLQRTFSGPSLPRFIGLISSVRRKQPPFILNAVFTPTNENARDSRLWRLVMTISRSWRLLHPPACPRGLPRTLVLGRLPRLCFRPDSRLSPGLLPSALPAIPLPAVFGVPPSAPLRAGPPGFRRAPRPFCLAAGQLPTDRDFVAGGTLGAANLCMQAQNLSLMWIAGEPPSASR
jgi:hypothetical protein